MTTTDHTRLEAFMGQIPVFVGRGMNTPRALYADLDEVADAFRGDGALSSGDHHWRNPLPVRLLLISAIIALALVAAACGSGESSAPVSVVVPGTEQWTDTGIDLSIDDMVSIEADGEITPSTPHVPLHGPNGLLDPAARRFNVEGLEEANHAGLIGRIGEAGAPFQVGSQLLSKVDTEGRLFLGINDGDVGNNAGEFTATITVNP
jgi:hypothetical protein